jgi:hypothetical protein
MLITVKKAEEHAKAELEVESNYGNLFRLDSSQSQNDPPNSESEPSSPTQEEELRLEA